MMIRIKPYPIVVAIVLTLIPACGGWVGNRAVMRQYATEDVDISPDLVKTNIATTDYSAIVHITRGRVKENSPLRRLGGYVNHIYQARVIENLRGPRYETITFSVMADSDIDPILPDHPVIVSLCGKSGDAMYVPDNGYELPATPALTAAARDAARRLKASSHLRSVCTE
ncbi:MAG TPA: hypothetical protein PLM53_17035 [Spirochaetota bacterium]|nr:hypothetical protein [Spirochaetota bacterium]HPC42965.1 hypothetical protein [Spirochaetota bacterium]HPL18566.1 hypothetical protein [Spirochaetota bacterium]HQH98804.1 hypothetical protein [Spirochaetota bacterium]HQJ70455.1 hypothetical protein [Spirochaetota bacterium]